MPANMEEKKEDNNTDAIMTGSNYSKIKASTILNKELCLEMMQTSIDWSLSNGLTMGSQKIDNAFIHAPHTLLPILLSLSDHQKLSNISLIFHKLIDSLSRDDKFLISCIKQTAESDKDFTGKMLSLYQKQINDKKNNLNQKYQLGIFRSDYMKNSINDKKWGQIEFNTIAASFGALSDLVFNLHKLLLSRFMNIDNVPTSNINTKYNDNDSKLYRPCCDTTKSIAKALGTAAKLVHPDNPIVLMLIQPGEKNSSDQRRIEWALWNEYKVKMIRRSMIDVYNNGKLDDNTKDLIIDNKYRISTVYYRCGYTPNDYGKDGFEWKAREIMEFSTAIKCPSIGYHLIGSKQFQTIFNKKDVLLRYLNENEANELLSVFVKLYSLENNESDDEIKKIIEDAKINYKNYVLKPQREGGGNNYYNDDIPKMIKKLNNKELAGYILMERIYPQEIDTIQIRNFESFTIKAICEMGIYSTYLSNGIDKDNIILNDVVGTLLRTKQAQVTEGGVATGYAVLDSILLSNDNK